MKVEFRCDAPARERALRVATHGELACIKIYDECWKW